MALSINETHNSNSTLGEAPELQLKYEGVPNHIIMLFLEHLAKPELSKSSNGLVIGTAVEFERIFWAYVAYNSASKNT